MSITYQDDVAVDLLGKKTFRCDKCEGKASMVYRTTSGKSHCPKCRKKLFAKETAFKWGLAQ